MLPVVSPLICSTYERFSFSVVVQLSDAELTVLGFLGPGESLRPFACLSLTYRHALAAAQQVIELIAAIKKVPDQFQCAFLSLFFFRGL